jgi:cytidine deaminase
MEAKDFSFTFYEYNSLEDLNHSERELVNAARKAALNAYAPYSGFSVGAAVRLESGKIITGANVENAAFPSGICAERAVLSNSASNHPSDKAVTLAVAAISEEELTTEPVPPCGNCRQVIIEEEFRSQKNIRIILSGKSKIQIIEKGGDLLPLQFNRNNLKANLPL